MKSLRLRLFILGLLMTFAFQPLAVAQSGTSFNKAKLNTYLEKLFHQNKFMGSIAIDSAGRQVYARAFGYAKLGDNKQQADTETRYRIGSVTKIFTATMIFQLIEEGKLSLSTKLTKYYPKIPQAKNITIEHMLRHQSGLYNFTNASDYPTWMTVQRSKEQLLQLFREDKPQFAPGSKTSYSNTNYVLLGFIIEDITGDSYAEQLQKRIAQPLNLTHTYYGDGINPNKNEATSFAYGQGQWTELPETDMSIPGGAGAIVSTPGDLTDFIHALFEGTLVSQKSLEKMTTIQQGMGMGLVKIPFNDRYAYGHDGGIDGFQSKLFYFPEEEIAYAFSGNGMSYSMNDIMIGALSIYFGSDFEIPSFDKPTISLDAQQMQKYVGKYVSGQLPMDIELFVEDSTLMAQATGQSAFPLTATNKTTLRFERAGIVMEFDSLEAGRYQNFTLKQGAGTYLFKRKNNPK